jgi:hypothetical protein
VYKIQNDVERPTLTSHNDDLYGALNAAWELYRMTEAPVLITEDPGYNEETGLYDGAERPVARLTVEFLDG